MSKGLKIMSLGVINHGMSLSVLYIRDCKRIERDRLILSVKSDYFVEIHEKITRGANKSLIIDKTSQNNII